MSYEEIAASLQLLAEEKVGGPNRSHTYSEESAADRSEAALLRDIQLGRL